MPEPRVTPKITPFLWFVDDAYWTKLTADGAKESMRGWLQDKYSCRQPGELPSDQDPARAARVSKVMFTMHKLDLPALEAAPMSSDRSTTMRFMLMKFCTRSEFESLGSWKPAEFEAHITFILDLQEQLERSGELVLAEGNIKVVRAERVDQPIVSDGPFAETKEFLAGFWIVDVDSPQRAYAIAAAASVAPGPGGRPMAIPIEVQQVMRAPDA